jgi:hypothetical protein
MRLRYEATRGFSFHQTRAKVSEVSLELLLSLSERTITRMLDSSKLVKTCEF